MAAAAAVSGLRACDQTGTIGMLSAEADPPYDRPPLSKGLWQGKPIESIWKKLDTERLSLHLDTMVAAINPEKKEVTDSRGNLYSYNKLLLATGGTPKRLNCPDPGVIYLRTLQDYIKLRELYGKGQEFLVIGGGFIGTEIAAVLRMNGKDVTLVFKETTLGEKLYPHSFSKFLSSYFDEQGVILRPQDSVKSIAQYKERFKVTMKSDQEYMVDGIVAGLGITPNTQLAEKAGLEVNNGVVVNEMLQTSNPDIYAAGDIANFYSPHLEKRLRIEHENCATTTGEQAGRNMAGKSEPYNTLPFFYSDLFDLGYEAVGEISSRFDIVQEWEEPNRRGSLYYLKEGRLRGAMFWGLWNKIDEAREAIAANVVFHL